MLPLLALLPTLLLCGCRDDRRLAVDFAQANQQLQQGQAQPAADSYQQQLTRSGFRPGLLRNLALAEQARQQPGPALLALERARLLQPRDRALSEQLNQLRQQQGLQPDPQLEPPRWATLLSRREWSWLAVAATAGLLLLWLVTLTRGLIRPQSRLPWAASLAPLLLGIIALSALWLRRAEAQLAIVLSAGPAQLSPQAQAPPAQALLPGQRVLTNQQQGNWIWLTQPDGSPLGWVPADRIQSIEPARGTRTQPLQQPSSPRHPSQTDAPSLPGTAPSAPVASPLPSQSKPLHEERTQ